jgi:hypothetical protein
MNPLSKLQSEAVKEFKQEADKELLKKLHDYNGAVMGGTDAEYKEEIKNIEQFLSDQIDIAYSKGREEEIRLCIKAVKYLQSLTKESK